MSQCDNMQDERLDAQSVEGKWAVMTRTPLIIALAAAAALAGCNKEDHTIVAGGPDAEADNSRRRYQTAGRASAVDHRQQVLPLRRQQPSLRRLDVGRQRPREEVCGRGRRTLIAAGAAELKGDAKAASITYKGESCKA